MRIETLEDRLCLSTVTLNAEVQWERSSAKVVGNSTGSTVDAALVLDTDITDPAAVWDSTYLYSSAPPAEGTLWASWNDNTVCDLHNYSESRLFRGTFNVSATDLANGLVSARLYDPFKPGGEIPINDAMYVYLNGTRVTQLSAALTFFGVVSGYGTYGVDVGSNTALAPETDGWYVNAVNLPVDLLVAGNNELRIVAEDVCLSGAIGFMAVDLTVNEPVVTGVQVDVKPGSTVNPVNLGSNGVLPAAFLSSSDFDATQVNPSTVVFGDSSGSVFVGPAKHVLQDVNGDGSLDLLLHFSIAQLRLTGALTAGSVEAQLSGETFDGALVSGTDSVQIVSSSAGLFRNGAWYFDMNGDGHAGEKTLYFGVAGDTPIVGDWDGDGADDIGVYRRGMWYFDLDGQGGFAEKWFAFGVNGDTPIVGDWDGDGTTDVGVFRKGMWYFDLDGLGLAAEKSFAFGGPGDKPVVSDWNGDGTTDAGVFRHGMWYYDLDGQGQVAEKQFAFGVKGDNGVVGDWDGNGDYEVAVVRNGVWYFDLDGKGGGAEHAFAYGLGTDLSFTGHWGDDENDNWAAGVDAALAVL